METAYSFFEKVGLPTSFLDIGIKEINKTKLMEVALKACAPTESIHHEAVYITPDKVMNAMILADAMGRARKLL
jgi:glycerol dehydrogenase